MRRNQVDLWAESEDMSGTFVVHAGIAKRTGRQLYLSTFKDCDDWLISVVPTEMSHSRATKMIAKAEAELRAKMNKDKSVVMPKFEIIKA